MTESENQPAKISRRTLLGGAATVAVAVVETSLGKTVGGNFRQISMPEKAPVLPDDPTKQMGIPPGKVGTRSAFEKVVKSPSDSSSRSPLQDLYGTITPSDLHFERHHNGVPAIDPNKYELLIHGLVERSTVFSLADLKRFPSVSRIAFLECSGNFRTGKETMTPQDVCGLTSQSEWTGVLLSTLFREVGVKSPSTDGRPGWFLAEGGDSAVMTRSIPTSKGWNDAVIAYAQNGEALRPEQGYPVRLFLPGWEGNTSVKWLRRIELGDAPGKPAKKPRNTAKASKAVKFGSSVSTSMRDLSLPFRRIRLRCRKAGSRFGDWPGVGAGK